jgi:hypothetical protein
MSSMTLLIVYFVTANYDTLDGIWPTLFIVWKEPHYKYCKFLTRLQLIQMHLRSRLLLRPYLAS